VLNKLRSKLSLRQKHLIKYGIAIFSTLHIFSLVPFLGRSIRGHQEVREMWKLLHPKTVSCGLRRIGSDKDGGYLIPDINHIFDGLISPGVGDTFSFELDFVGKETKAVLIDATVSKPINLPTNMIFLSKMLGPVKSDDGLFVTLQDIRSEYFPFSKSLALQMDIEGGEYKVLESTKREDLAGIDLILVEFHNLHEITTLDKYRNPLRTSLNMLKNDFQLVHTHPNNAGGFFCQRFRVFPKVVETTWIRKSLVQISSRDAVLPHPLDIRNDPLIWDLGYPKFVNKSH